MSLRSLPSAATESAPYKQLLTLHESNASACDQETLDGLSEKFRKKIFFDSSKQAEEPDEAEYGKRRVFDHLSEQQQAVKQVAVVASCFLSTSDKDGTAWSIRHSHQKPVSEDRNWREQHSADDIPFLLETIHLSLSDPNHGLQTILKDWITRAKSGYLFRGYSRAD